MSHYVVMLATSKQPTEKQIAKIMRPHRNDVWDWYVIGGRWMGFFTMKPGTSGLLGECGVMGNKAPEGTADQARKCDIDFEGMLAKQRENARERHRKITALRKRRSLKNKEFQTELTEKGLIPWFTHLEKYYIKDENAFAERSAWSALLPYGFIDGMDGEGEYVESGMGWGANFTEAEYWEKRFQEWLATLPDDCWMTVVDCHM